METTQGDGLEWQIARARKGDASAFEAIYRSHCDRIYGLCWRLCGGDSGLAEDLTQEAFIRAYNKLDSFRGEAKFSTWLHRLTVNLVLSELRRSPHKQVLQDIDKMPEQMHSSMDDAGLRKDLEEALAKLPDQARSVIVLHDIEGWKHREIAEAMNMAEGSSKAQLHRARKLLQGMLQ